MNSKPHWAARAEDLVVGRVAAVLRRRHWKPGVVPYTGYGADGWVRVFARAVLSPPGTASAQVSEEDNPRPVRGWRSFVSAEVPFQPIEITVAGTTHHAVADRGGYVDVRLPATLDPGWHEVTFLVAGGEPVSGPVLVVGPERATAIVSDIDDTVMITALPRPLLAAWNAFVLHEHARRAVPGMPELFRRWQTAHAGPPVFYLSTGAWNTAPALVRFLSRNDFPPGPLLLTDWGPTNTGWFRSGMAHKRASLNRLITELPQLSWALVGDDGQHDPELYAQAATDHPGSVEVIAIRRLSPAEQVLAHGIPLPLRQAEEDDAPLVVHGTDGHELVLRLVDIGLLPPVIRPGN